MWLQVEYVETADMSNTYEISITYLAGMDFPLGSTVRALPDDAFEVNVVHASRRTIAFSSIDSGLVPIIHPFHSPVSE